MRKILKLNHVPIWNLPDLQREFSPLAAYEVIQDFCYFARVHCVPLPLHLQNGKNGKATPAVYLKKEFWLDILTRRDWPETKSAAECMTYFVQKCYEEASGIPSKKGGELAQGDDIKAQIEQETCDAMLTKKLEHICKSGGFQNNPEDSRKAVMLLAICELAEVNPLTQTFQQMQVSSAERKEPDAFLYEKNAALVAAEEPYQFWYHDDDTIPEGKRIRTVCVKSQPGTNPYTVVKIELYSKKTKECVQKITLAPDEYCYCNALEGSIVCILPNVDIGRDLCLFRKNSSRADYEIVPRNGAPWNLKHGNISCVAVAEREADFLLLADGKVNTAFYKPAKDYLIQLQFDMIMGNAVEILFTQKGCSVLLEDGTVLTNGKAEAEKRVRLRGNHRAKASAEDIREVALSADGSAAVALRKKGAPLVCFNHQGFRARQADGTTIVDF